MNTGEQTLRDQFTERELRRFLQEFAYLHLPHALACAGYKRCYQRLAEIAEYIGP